MSGHTKFEQAQIKQFASIFNFRKSLEKLISRTGVQNTAKGTKNGKGGYTGYGLLRRSSLWGNLQPPFWPIKGKKNKHHSILACILIKN